ncbi:MAG: Fe(3+) ABC transporter substrate-binding protein, partial [Planctomycetota bacterium]
RENAIRFIEFLISDEAQEALASQNFEFPVVKGIGLNPVLDEFGSFKAEKLVVSELGRNNRKAVQIMDRAAWR